MLFSTNESKSTDPNLRNLCTATVCDCMKRKIGLYLVTTITQRNEIKFVVDLRTERE